MIKDNLFGLGELSNDMILNFNPKNTRVQIREHDRSYGGYRFKMVISATCCNEKLKKLMDKTRSGVYRFEKAFKQLELYLNMHGVYSSSLNVARKEIDVDKRASKGTKGISLTYYFTSPRMAVAYGYNDDNYSSDVILDKELVAKRLKDLDAGLLSIEELSMEQKQKSLQKSKITGKDDHEIWKSEHQEVWINKLNSFKKDFGVHPTFFR